MGIRSSAPAPANNICSNCANFRNDPAYLERAIPGCSSMGSAWASVRSSDGLCTLHDRYLSSTSGCQQFEPAKIMS
jgi:hypothetical protein